MQSKLSVCEYAVYFSVWVLACFYSLQQLVAAQTDILKNPKIQYTIRDLNQGWRILRRPKDESDVEWSTWMYFAQLSWFYMILQFFISEFIRRTNASFLNYWYIISSVVFIVNFMGLKQLLIILSQPVIFWVVVTFGGNKICIWLASFILLAAYNSLKFRDDIWYILDSEKDEEIFVLLYAIPWVELRCISFCLNHVDKTNRLKKCNDSSFRQSVFLNIINMFSYVLYLPVLFTGPIIVYEEYEKSFHVRNRNLKQRLKQFMWDMTVYLVYSVLLEFAFHYIYFYAMQSNIKAIEMLPSAALCGGGLWMGLQFHLKYVISYGITTSYARLDNIDAPPTPRCIARIHVYSQMWRYFDVGLYRFLFMYIYTPVYNKLKAYGTTSKITSKLLSSLATFVFIFMWHGTTWKILVWSVLNYFGIVLEYLAKVIGDCGVYIWFKQKLLKTEAMEVRFIAFLCAPLLCMSAISNFYLFAGTEVGDLYFNMLISPSMFNGAILYVSLYASCHVAIALKDVPSRMDVKKIPDD